MKFATLIAENARWSVNKNPFECLWAQTTTKEVLYEQLRALGERYYHERKAIQTAKTEFCLNYLALKIPSNFCQREVLRHFDQYWQRFVRLQNIFERGATYPSNGTTRLEQIASLIAKCTGFCLGDEELLDILHDCKHLANLTEREVETLPLVVDLYKINYFCALGYQVFANNALAKSIFWSLCFWQYRWQKTRSFPKTSDYKMYQRRCAHTCTQAFCGIRPPFPRSKITSSCPKHRKRTLTCHFCRRFDRTLWWAWWAVLCCQAILQAPFWQGYFLQKLGNQVHKSS